MCSPSLRRLLAVAVSLGAICATGCVEHALVETLRPTEYPIPVETPPPAPSDGAIWRGGSASGSFLYYDRKARGVGDLVTVVLLESLSAEGSANTELEKGSSFSADLTSDIGFTDLLQDGADLLFGALGVDGGGDAEAGQTVNVVQSNQNSGFTGDGETNRSSTFSGVVTCRVVGVLPGDVYHVYGKRQLLVNHELQLVTVEGLVRRKDINIDNTVASTQLADVKLTFDGIGVIDDKQRPSLLARLLDWVYPF